MRLNIPSNVSMFIKDYRLPLWSTAGFVTILVLLLGVRIYERSILAGVLGDSSSVGKNYARLLSNDADVALQKNDVTGNQTTSAQSSAPSSSTPPTSLTIDSSGESTTDESAEDVAPPSDEGTTEEPPAEPFSAQLSGFGLRSQSGPFVCTTSGPSGSPSQMCKQYDFVGGIKTLNGPGTVTHEIRWQGASSGSASGAFQAAAGDGLTQVNHSVKLRCDQLGQYVFKLFITKPGTTESHQIPISHNCFTTSGG